MLPSRNLPHETISYSYIVLAVTYYPSMPKVMMTIDKHTPLAILTVCDTNYVMENRYWHWMLCKYTV